MPNEPVIITETAPDGSEAEFEISTAKADETSGSVVEEVVNALFDDGQQEISVEFSDSDGDGKLDTAAADMNQDGTVDTAVMDTDGDGKFDTGVSDMDGDGKIDLVAVDTDGDGLLDTAVADTDGDGNVDTVMVDSDGDGVFDTAVADTDGDGRADAVMVDSDGDGEFDVVETIEEVTSEESMSVNEGLPSEEELSMNSVEFNLGSEAFTDIPGAIAGDGATFDPLTTNDPYLSETPSSSEIALDQESAEREAQAEIARDAQMAADEFVEKGDYQAAAEAREQAEAAASEAGDSSMLGAYDAQDLEYAADKQAQAAEFREQQAERLAEGDYEGARQAAFESEWATRGADMTAGGADHTGQAQTDQDNLEWATYHQEIADENARSAEAYAAEGDFDTAGIYADRVADHEAAAGDYAVQADPNNIMYDSDPSSMVETGGTYDASLASVDTGFDAPMDAGASSFDTTTDDTL